MSIKEHIEEWKSFRVMTPGEYPEFGKCDHDDHMQALEEAEKILRSIAKDKNLFEARSPHIIWAEDWLGRWGFEDPLDEITRISQEAGLYDLTEGQKHE